MARGTFTSPIEDQLAQNHKLSERPKPPLTASQRKNSPSSRIEPSVSRSFNPYDHRSNHWAIPTYYNLAIFNIYLNFKIFEIFWRKKFPTTRIELVTSWSLVSCLHHWAMLTSYNLVIFLIIYNLIFFELN
jgi:hypothetical protein